MQTALKASDEKQSRYVPVFCQCQGEPDWDTPPGTFHLFGTNEGELAVVCAECGASVGSG